jgi:hypothetical protein
MFWAYIWFCQYMLIWYANLPEEVSHYLTRTGGGWGPLFWLNPIVNFGIPFFVLLSARAKRREDVLYQMSLLVLVGRWLDVYLLVEPSTSPSVSAPFFHVAATVLVVVGMLTWAARGASGDRVAPRRTVRSTG